MLFGKILEDHASAPFGDFRKTILALLADACHERRIQESAAMLAMRSNGTVAPRPRAGTGAERGGQLGGSARDIPCTCTDVWRRVA